MSHAPQAIRGPAYDLVQRISPLVRELDFGLDWMELEAGRALYRYCYSNVCGLAYVSVGTFLVLITLLFHANCYSFFHIIVCVASFNRNCFPLRFCSQGEQATCAYIVLQGRLRSVVKKSDGKKEMLEELGRGEAVGVVCVHV